jgi:hypothetical protein
MERVIHTLQILALCLPALACRPQQPPERVIALDLLDNGSFEESAGAAADEQGAHPIAWWRTRRGREQLQLSEGKPCLLTRADDWAEQPIAAYAPLASRLVLEGEVHGDGLLTLSDGSGRRARVELAGSGWHAFVVRDTKLVQPRFLLRLEALGKQDALWRSLHARVALPCPDEPALREEIRRCLAQIVAPWLEHGLDEEGPRKTALVTHVVDAVTGERLGTDPGGFHPFWEQLWTAARASGDARWNAAFERYASDYLELCLDPGTGLPRLWDGERDVPLPASSVEIALPLGFLVDLADHGPQKLRERAKAAALKIGETVLREGVMPDGSISAKYFPASAKTDPGVNSLRRFDVAAQLARLTALSGDARFLRASGEALAAFEFTQVWAGAWSSIDPAFDDDFGTYGARAVTIAGAAPQDELFRHFALEGFAHFEPLWRDALRLGGNVAADQVRCWTLLADLARLDEQAAQRIRTLLAAAVRSHFKGEQYEDGAWGDVTIYGFDPISNLQVGDYPGAPQNLLHGLAAVYRKDLGLRTDEQRALYTAVLRSSIATYLEPHGFLMLRKRSSGANPAYGTLRMMLGLSKMLQALR